MTPLVRFELQMTDEELRDLARSLQKLTNAVANAKPIIDSPVRPDARAASTVAAVPSLHEVEPRDRWAHDRDGKEVPQPAAEAYTAKLWKCEQVSGKRGPFLDVRWEQRRAYCWDQKLFPWLLAAAKSKQQIVLYLKENGNYQHIVGVKA